MSGPRIRCCIPFCKRTDANKRGWREWICPKHWRYAPERLKAIHRRRQRAARKAGAGAEYERAARLENANWGRIKRALLKDFAI